MENLKEMVGKLNDRLFEIDDEYESCNSFIYSSCGHCESILFGDTLLWNSEDDDREYNEETNEYEDLKTFVVKQFNKYIDRIQNLTLPEIIWDAKGYKEHVDFKNVKYDVEKDWYQTLISDINILSEKKINETIITEKISYKKGDKLFTIIDNPRYLYQYSKFSDVEINECFTKKQIPLIKIDTINQNNFKDKLFSDNINYGNYFLVGEDLNFEMETITKKALITADDKLRDLFLDLIIYNQYNSTLYFSDYIVNFKENFNNMIEVNGSRIKVINYGI